MKRYSAEKLTIRAILIAIALTLSYMERLLPLQLFIPLPGIKLGLANIIVMFALYFLGFKSAFVILIIKCLLGSFFGGGITGLVFSVTGGVMSLLLMQFSKRVRLISVFGVSILGSAAHVTGQIFAAMAVMKSLYIISYLPFLLIASVFTGFATGAAACGVFKAVIKSESLVRRI